jgi:hypothetical protein
MNPSLVVLRRFTGSEANAPRNQRTSTIPWCRSLGAYGIDLGGQWATPSSNGHALGLIASFAVSRHSPDPCRSAAMEHTERDFKYGIHPSFDLRRGVGRSHQLIWKGVRLCSEARLQRCRSGDEKLNRALAQDVTRFFLARRGHFQRSDAIDIIAAGRCRPRADIVIDL